MISVTTDSVRRICEDLRPGMLDDLGLEAALSSYAKRFSSQFGVACDLSLDREDYGLGDPVSTAIFRIVQESLTNVARHARASHAMVSLQDRGNTLLLTIADDGCGLSPELTGERKTYGLLGMRERVNMLGGTIAIDSAPGRGTHIEVSIPRSREQPA
jgi:signal transduction histidine kinase